MGMGVPTDLYALLMLLRQGGHISCSREPHPAVLNAAQRAGWAHEDKDGFWYIYWPVKGHP